MTRRGNCFETAPRVHGSPVIVRCKRRVGHKGKCRWKHRGLITEWESNMLSVPGKPDEFFVPSTGTTIKRAVP